TTARPKPKDVQLLATIVARESFAIVRTREVVVVVPGSHLGDAVVQTIEERRIVFEDGDEIGFERAVAALTPPATPPATTVDRAPITSILAHPEELARTVTAVPAADGIRIVALRPQSPLARLGVQRGDVIRAVNGCELFGIDASIECYRRLHNARFVSV